MFVECRLRIVSVVLFVVNISVDCNSGIVPLLLIVRVVVTFADAKEKFFSLAPVLTSFVSPILLLVNGRFHRKLTIANTGVFNPYSIIIIMKLFQHRKEIQIKYYNS